MKIRKPEFFLIIILIGITILIVLISPIDLVTRLILVSPYLILLINQKFNQINEERKEAKITENLRNDLQNFLKDLICLSKNRNIPYFYKKIKKETEKFGKYFGVEIIYSNDLDIFTTNYLEMQASNSGYVFHYEIDILDGDYEIKILEDTNGYEVFRKCNIALKSSNDEKDAWPIKYEEFDEQKLIERVIHYCRKGFNLEIKNPFGL